MQGHGGDADVQKHGGGVDVQCMELDAKGLGDISQEHRF